MIYKTTHKLVVLFSLCFMSCVSMRAQTADIGPGFADTLLCVKGNMVVPVTVSTQFDDTNFFLIQISNASGSFSSPTVIGNLQGGLQGTAYCTLPASIPAGTGYRIRVVANHPAYTSLPNNKNIRISDIPVTTLNTNAPLCVGQPLSLTSTTGSPLPTYLWTGPHGFSSTLQNPGKSSTTFNDSGMYHLSVTSYMCTSHDSINVLILPSPIFTKWGGDTSVCEDAKFSLNPNCNVCTLSTQIVKFDWAYPPSRTSKQSTVSSQSAILGNQGWFKVTVTIGNCSATDSSYLEVRPLPDTPAATNNGPLCVGETLILNGNSTTPGVTYRWEGPGGFTATGASYTKANITKSDEGDFYVYAVHNGCESKPGTTKLKVGIPLVALPITGDTMLCPGGKLQLSTQTTVTTGISWKKVPDTTTISIARTYGKTPVSASDAGTYSVTQEVLGCKSPPSYITIRIPDIKQPKPANNGPLCPGETMNLSATATDNGTYNWTGPNGFTSNAQNPSLHNATEAMEGNYFVTTTLDYCTESDSTRVIIKPMPEIKSISSNSPVCTYTFLNLFSESTLDSAHYTWTGPNGYHSADQNPSVYFTDELAGSYTVSTTTDGCTSAPRSIDVVSKEGPGPSKAGSNSPLEEGEELDLTANNDKEGVSFMWTGPDGFTSTEKKPVIATATYRNAGVYELTTSFNDCITTTQTVVIIKDLLGISLDLYPNPNDGKFTIRGITQTDATMTLNIYNHQGMIVHKSTITPDKSKFKTEIDLRGSASGVYLLQLTTGSEKRTVRFTIVRQ